MDEIWKDVEGHEGVYMVSNLGRVMSLDYRHTGKKKILKPIKIANGYLGVHRRNYGGKWPIHRLVAKAFIPNPNNYPCVNHKNENKGDNRACNLEWCDHQYNNTYGNRLKKMANTRRNGVRTHTGNVLQYSIDGELISTYPSTIAASKATGIERSGINRCALGVHHTAGGYKWVYEW